MSVLCFRLCYVKLKLLLIAIEYKSEQRESRFVPLWFWTPPFTIHWPKRGNAVVSLIGPTDPLQHSYTFLLARANVLSLNLSASNPIWFQSEMAFIETAACYVLSLEEVRLSSTLTASQLPITVCKSHREAKEPWHLLRLTVLYWWGFTLRVKSLLSIALLWHSVKWPIGTNNMKYSVSVTSTLPNPTTPSHIHNLCSNVSVHCNSY